MIIRKIVLAVFATAMIVACGDKKGGKNSSESEFTRVGEPENMEVEVIENYFPKKEITPNVIQFYTIDNEKEFNQKFGVAKTMNNKVTPIDFSKNRVGVIILPETNKKTTIEIDDTERIGSGAVIEYEITEGEEQSFSTTPALIFKLPGDNRLKTIEFKAGKEVNVIGVPEK